MDFLVHGAAAFAYESDVDRLGSRVLRCRASYRSPRYLRELYGALRRYGPYDVIHSHVNLFGGIVTSVARAARVPARIAHLYDPIESRAGTITAPYTQAMLWLISANATKILSDSQAALSTVPSWVRRRRPAQVTYCGIDVGHFASQVPQNEARRQLALPEEKFIVLYVARLVPHKNHAQLLRIADECAATGLSDIHFVLAGSHGSETNALFAECDRRSNTTILLGLPDVSVALHASDAFFFPSLREGFGIVALEAAAAGLPVIASDLDTIREACAPACRPLMFPPNDDAAATASILRLYRDRDLLDTLGAASRQWAENFNVQVSAKALFRHYGL